MSDTKGFTLIELIVVMIIVSILAAIAIPNYLSMMNQGAANSAQNNLITIYNAQKIYYATNGAYCTSTTGAPSDTPCGDTWPHLNAHLATLDQPNPTSLSLNITDNYFSYACVTDTSGFKCTATNVSNTNFILTVTNIPIVLPGGTGTLNPSCSPSNNPNCPAQSS